MARPNPVFLVVLVVLVLWGILFTVISQGMRHNPPPPMVGEARK